jgi:hypothetical protein
MTIAIFSLDWNYSLSKSLSIDDFEMARSFHRRNGPRIMPWRDRKDVLLEWGTTFSEITNVVRETHKAKHKRRQTVQSIGRYDRFEEILETATQKLKQTLSLEKVYKKHLNRRLAKFIAGKISSDESPGSSQSQNSSESATPSMSSRDDCLVSLTPEMQVGKRPDRPIKLSALKTERDYSTVAITPSVSSRDERDLLGSTTDDEKPSLIKQDKPVSKPVRSPSLSHSDASMSFTTDGFESSPFAVSETSCDVYSSFSTINTREESNADVSSFSTYGKQEEIDGGTSFALITSKVDIHVGDCELTFTRHVECFGTPANYILSQNAMSSKERSPNAMEAEEYETSLTSQYLNLLDDGSVTESASESQAESSQSGNYGMKNDVSRSENVSVPMRFRIPKPVSLGHF